MPEPLAVLCGGLGGSRLVHALSLAAGAERVTAIGNVGDDLELLVVSSLGGWSLVVTDAGMHGLPLRYPSS